MEEIVEGPKYLKCIYCGQEYHPEGDKPVTDDVLAAHVQVCPKHPLAKERADKAMLRKALVGLVGADSKADLDNMELAIRMMRVADRDKAVSLNAIDALRATLPEEKPSCPSPSGT